MPPVALTVTGTATDVAWAGVARHLVVLATSPVGPVQADLAYGVDTKKFRLHFRLGFTF